MNDNRIAAAFKKPSKLLSVFFTAGHPALNTTVEIIQVLEQQGVGMIEIGFPFSDPLADGPTIQRSNEIAIENGMTLERLFSELERLREKVTIPVLLMGYLNPVLRFGFENFCAAAAKVGIDGVIIPDLPHHEYLKQYRETLEQHNLSLIFMITPETSRERILEIDQSSSGFIYALTASSITGNTIKTTDLAESYLSRLKELRLTKPIVAGFGVHDRRSFEVCAQQADGVVIGSAFVKALNGQGELRDRVANFIKGILG